MARVTLIAKTYLKLPSPSSGRIEYADASLPGFYLRVSSSGSRSFVIRYRLAGGPPRRYTLGASPPLELGSARERARELLKRVKLAGEDPALLEAQRRGDAVMPSGPTLAELAGRYIEARSEDTERPLADSTGREYRRILKAHLEADAPAGAAAMMRSADLRAYLRRAVTEHGRTEANRLFALVRAACRWARSEELIDRNPADGIKRPAEERSRERVLTNAEMAALWKATEAEVLLPGADQPETCPPPHAAAVRLQLFLGQRPTETLSMRWKDLDLEGKRWTIPAKFRKGYRTQVVPLPPAAVRIIEALQPLVAGEEERVLAGASLKNPSGWWDPIRDRAIKLGAQPFTRHDLRRTCATGCASLGAPPHVVSRILGHKMTAGTLAVTGIYDRFDRLPEVASALNAWGANVERIAVGGLARAVVTTIRR